MPSFFCLFTQICELKRTNGTNDHVNQRGKMNRLFDLIMMVIFSVVLYSQVFAHSSIKTTIPENGAILDEVPATILIQMTNKIRLIKVEMQHEDHTIIEIDLSDYREFQTDFTLPIKSRDAGVYGISWRALGD